MVAIQWPRLTGQLRNASETGDIFAKGDGIAFSVNCLFTQTSPRKVESGGDMIQKQIRRNQSSREYIKVEMIMRARYNDITMLAK
jgi:hypothetical protein